VAGFAFVLWLKRASASEAFQRSNSQQSASRGSQNGLGALMLPGAAKTTAGSSWLSIPPQLLLCHCESRYTKCAAGNVALMQLEKTKPRAKAANMVALDAEGKRMLLNKKCKDWTRDRCYTSRELEHIIQLPMPMWIVRSTHGTTGTTVVRASPGQAVWKTNFQGE